MMKYPKDIGPQSQTELYALLFTMLGNAYNCLAQYEADERQQEQAEHSERIRNLLVDKERERAWRERRSREDQARDPVRTEAAHREDEAQ